MKKSFKISIILIIIINLVYLGLQYIDWSLFKYYDAYGIGENLTGIEHKLYSSIYDRIADDIIIQAGSLIVILILFIVMIIYHQPDK